MFEVTGEKTNNISFLIDALKTVPSISIESRSEFSAARLFITKLRARLSDRSIDHISFSNHIIHFLASPYNYNISK